MWEEDPRVQDANFKVLVTILALIGVVFCAIAIRQDDWQIAKYYFAFFATLLAALCIYAAFIWVTCNVIALAARAFRKRANSGK